MRKSNEMIKFITPDFEFGDERGKLIQLVHEGWKQVNYITSFANQIRGGHYHKYNREAFFILTGKFKLLLSCAGKNLAIIIEREDFFIIEPNVKHTFEYIEYTSLISLYDKGVENEDGTKDIYV